MSESILLGYWGFRARGQVPRLLLAYTAATWTEKKYYSQDQWKGIGKDQTSLGLPFPNLPYIIHGDFKLTESRAIINYIINISDKKQLLGKDYKDSGIVQNLVSVWAELLGKISELVLNVETFDEKLPGVTAFLQPKLQILETYCSGKKFALGYLTLADFMIAEGSYYIENVFPDLAQKYPSLKKIRQQFQGLEQIKAYYVKQTAVKGPFLPPIGKIKF